jgi:two-component system KDP operon response regulator KdpE
LVFAHPDDESSSVAGTTAKHTQHGVSVDLICATGGEKGTRLDVPPDVDTATAREAKLRLATGMTGIRDIYLLGYMDGFQILRQIRDFSAAPLVILTARGNKDDKVRGLEEGADDYIIKPFSNAELVARLKSLIRRTDELTKNPLIRGKVRIDLDSQTLSVSGHLLKIGPREYELLHHFMTSEGTVLSNQMLLQEVFPDQASDVGILDAYINILRKKLGDDPDNPKMILNDGTTGYKFVSS